MERFKNVYIAEGAVVRGDDLTIGEKSSIWFNAVVRSDYGESVRIGERTNIQDLSMVHTSPGASTTIGDGVTVGHSCIIHACCVGDNTLIGMGSIILDGARVGKNCIIGAGSLVTKNTVIPDGSMAFGRPAKVVRPLTEEEIEMNRKTADEYVINAAAVIGGICH